ncbi:MAG: flagellar hook-basal body complex protein FliE [Acidobacteriia bacterium]|nr:flagellar hook-basal body complex protein FliE [Terriglobia bacterium]
MIGPIHPIPAPALPASIRGAGESPGGGAFGQAMAAALQGVEASGQTAAAAVEKFLSGDGEELHTTILAAQRAELALEMFLQARNKVVSAYQEIMRMQM